MKLNFQLFYSLWIASFFLAVSCSKNLNKTSKISSVQIYLESVNHDEKQSNDYGYIKENPIILKLSSEYKHENIISEYIKRLSKNRLKDSFASLQSFKIIDTSKFPINEDEAVNQSNEIDYERWIYKYTIISNDNFFKETLYFKLNKKQKHIYVPTGFLYGHLSG